MITSNTPSQKKRLLVTVCLFFFTLCANCQTKLLPQDKMLGFLKTLQEQYVDSLDMDALVDAMMEDALHALDPFSTYDNKEKTQEVNEYLGETGKASLNAQTSTSSPQSVSEVRIANDTIGYIHLLRFNEYTQKELNEAFDRLTAKKIKGIIIDLSGNHGGYLDVGIGVANEFLTRGMPICSTEGQHSPHKDYAANGKGRMTAMPLAIIVDSVAASAAEMISSCMQDNDRAVVIGQRTFGKGLTQKLFYLDDGTLLRLSFQRFYSPTGRCIQMPYDHKPRREGPYKSLSKQRLLYGGEGVMPDIATKDKAESLKAAVLVLSDNNKKQGNQ